MGDRSGVGLVECTILEALDSIGAQARRHRRSAKVLNVVEERIGLAPGYAYEVLLDLARPWTMPLLLVDGQGNFGTRGNDPAANYRYTIRDESSERHGDLLICVPARGTAPEQLREQLMNVSGVYTTVRVDLPRSLPATLRNWVKAHSDEDLLTSLAALEHAVRSQPARS